ncbi:MAG: DUF362 domain-containing protein [Planctomycetota bacterium]
MASEDQPVNERPKDGFQPTRRAAIATGAALGVAGLAAGSMPKHRAGVFVAKNQSYDGPLAQTIEDGLRACGLHPNLLRGRRVLLKPNLVEPTKRIPHMTTHPAVVLATAEVFANWGAKVSVGEAPGHVRDTRMALEESGLHDALQRSPFRFADLNYEEAGYRANRARASKLQGLYFPASVMEADYVVSMPKMKTHHWVGLTCSMKNLYGVLPGIKYGWPKNVLHHNGIPETVVDINATVGRTLTVVDAIDCMEGDGPILGSKKHMGLVLVGDNLPAVDATAARIMGLSPEKVSYLKIAGRLGPIADEQIKQLGDDYRELVSPFEILDEPHLRGLRAVGERVS